MTKDAKPEPTHYAVPLAVFEAARTTLGGLPHDQVSPLMDALADCQPMALLPNSPEQPKD
jgi:hypothetical protein